jgi:hypothetical protein
MGSRQRIIVSVPNLMPQDSGKAFAFAELAVFIAEAIGRNDGKITRRERYLSAKYS